ncbi:hypothetical protein LAP9435_3246 [Lactiplantibacillus plantarum]|nr:hypothetical protein LAP8962_03230 [Lactiplantibacillus plantarum]VFI65705.1 hypothetical protein LAP9434_03255 [Lactiplantibacillus plantarum]VFQ58207.1 hypothetical protein LAP9435_3246 [Lactiplantibacillus plantarum]
MPNQYEKLVEQQARLKQKIERENFKLRQSKYYEIGKPVKPVLAD